MINTTNAGIASIHGAMNLTQGNSNVTQNMNTATATVGAAFLDNDSVSIGPNHNNISLFPSLENASGSFSISTHTITIGSERYGAPLISMGNQSSATVTLKATNPKPEYIHCTMKPQAALTLTLPLEDNENTQAMAKITNDTQEERIVQYTFLPNTPSLHYLYNFVSDWCHNQNHTTILDYFLKCRFEKLGFAHPEFIKSIIEFLPNNALLQIFAQNNISEIDAKVEFALEEINVSGEDMQSEAADSA